MKTFRHIVMALIALVLVSCTKVELYNDMPHQQGEEVIMTFRPKFEDFESVTKAIGDGSQVDQLLVHVYEEGSDQFEEKTYDITSCQVQQEVKIPFFYGKKYKVYFWAYKSGDDSPYTLLNSNIGLKGGVSVDYPTNELGYDALESLDAFYAVSDVDLSKGRTMNINLTRPFAQVNLVAKKKELAAAQATKVEFTIKVAETFNLTSPTSEGTTEKTFTFTSTAYFQNTEELNQNTEELNVDVYLGTTYLFVPSSKKVTGKVKFYAGDNELKSAKNIEIPLEGNKRTNLVFSGIVPSVPDWDDTKDDTVPTPGSDGWIHISTPEQLAALLRTGVTSETKVHICKDLDMTNMPDEVKAEISGKSFTNLILDGAHYSGTLENHTVPETSVDGGAYKIKNFEGPAFLANATNLKVRNLGLEKVHITHKDKDEPRHVGTLVNTLKGTSSFSNINVYNSYATTSNGAAGGVVGYIVRNTPISRSESVSVSFDNCDLSAVTATGSLTDGKFVGRLSGYDNGEVVTFTTTCSAEGGNSSSMSKYVSSNLACWLTDDERSAFNGWIGDEVYYRGKVSYGDTRVAVKWDGTTTVEPLLANATYDSGTTAGTNRFVVYSAFDLAGVRKKTDSPTAIYLMNNVDMFGQGQDGKYNVPSEFIESAYNSIDDNKFNSFSYVSTLEGFNHTIYNLKIEHLAQGSTTAAFIGGASGTTYHQNTIFEGCCVVSTHKNVDTDAKAYGAIVCCNPGGTYTMTNIHVNNCKLFALQKVGIICSRVNGTSTFENCSVDNCYIENYKCTIEEDFAKLLTDKGLYCQKCIFYPYGEIGGFIGFLQANSIITSCSVTNTRINCYGQKDKSTRIGLNWLLAITYSVPGRHVNQFIGDIRTDIAQTINMDNCTVNANTYGHDSWNHSYSNSSTDLVGCAYAIPVMDDAGSIRINGTTIKIQGTI